MGRGGITCSSGPNRVYRIEVICSSRIILFRAEIEEFVLNSCFRPISSLCLSIEAIIRRIRVFLSLVAKIVIISFESCCFDRMGPSDPMLAWNLWFQSQLGSLDPFALHSSNRAAIAEAIPLLFVLVLPQIIKNRGTHFANHCWSQWLPRSRSSILDSFKSIHSLRSWIEAFYFGTSLDLKVSVGLNLFEIQGNTFTMK